MQVFVQSVGICGPGLAGWDASSRILAGLAPYRFAPLPRALPAMLPAAERRRSSESVRLAMAAGLEAMHHAGLELDAVATVFASSDGDGQIAHLICEALASNAREVSPTQFHNSVHNAAAGYWSIAARSQQPSTSLCAFDTSFAAGLLEAASQAVVDRKPVLLIAFDLPFPPPLAAVRPVDNGFAAAILMTPGAGSNSLAQWRIELRSGNAAAPLPKLALPPKLERALRSNPAARALPLLVALARAQWQAQASRPFAQTPANGQIIFLEYQNDRVLAVEFGS